VFLDAHIVDSVSEQRPHVLLTAPERRRLDAGGRRDMFTNRLEHPAYEAVGGPAGDGDHAAGSAHPHELRRGALVVRREHDAERGDHGVERGVLEWQVLGVAYDPVDVVEARGVGDLTPTRHELGHVVEAHDLGAAAGGGHGRVARAPRYVEHPRTRDDVSAIAQHLRDHCHAVGDETVIAARPGRLLLCLHRFEVRGGSGLAHGFLLSANLAKRPAPVRF
jgi:hypothetical protein